MKVLKYLMPLWFGVIIYAVSSFAFGAKGISAYNQLEAEKIREQANADTLIAINADLKETRDILSSDKENYLAYARELGFARVGEQFIRIVGLGTSSRPLRSPGEAVYTVPPVYIPDQTLRILSFFAAFTLLISMGVYDLLKFLKG
ncbi:MAG: septum formation initiator family protein [Treponema sp.]|jgi:cell division protein FtsB|nr:septum formation initiator family protein [Treponema sp.]